MVDLDLFRVSKIYVADVAVSFEAGDRDDDRQQSMADKVEELKKHSNERTHVANDDADADADEGVNALEAKPIRSRSSDADFFYRRCREGAR